MKVAVCGKGGSGKSTIVTLLAAELEARGYHVLVVDSDESNSGLFRMLGFDHPPVPLMELVGGRKGLKEKMASPEMGVMAQDKILLKDIPSQHVVGSNNLRLVNIGKILHSLEGCACPMGVLSREFLGKLCLEPNEIAIVDMEAGVEHFGRGVETSIDCVVVIVEPSFESLELALRIEALATGIGIKDTWTILNKISSDEIALRLKEELRKRHMEVTGVVHYDPEVFEACLEGRKVDGGVVAHEIGGVVDSLLLKA